MKLKYTTMFFDKFNTYNSYCNLKVYLNIKFNLHYYNSNHDMRLANFKNSW